MLLALVALFPGDPGTPLRQLWREAERVVVARAGTTEEGVATLDVERVLKGKPDLGWIRVHPGPDVVCPAPDRYPEGRTILAFLSWNERLGAWTAGGRACRAKVMTPELLALYLPKLEQLARIDAAPKAEREALTVEWLVSCMETPALRWEGAADFASPLSPSPAGCVTDITEAQWTRLLAAFAAVQEVGPTDYLMAEKVLAATPDRRVDDVLLRGLRQSLDAPSLHDGRRAMEILSARRNLGRGPVDAFDALPDGDARRAFLRRFLDRLAT
jgi:hypothetical protein